LHLIQTDLRGYIKRGFVHLFQNDLVKLGNTGQFSNSLPEPFC